jgi:glycosyltransferase involved in cell wall biosynthesis
MRVVLNNLTAIRRKTGIGHYVTELVRSLRARHVGHQFTTFPGKWVEAGVGAWGRIRNGLGVFKKTGSNGQAGDRPLRRWLNSQARAWAAWHFRTFWSGRSFDLYHEPNYIPLPYDGPTIATVHDLSVLLHPEWHPTDRVAHYTRHFEAGLKRCSHVLVPSRFTRRELIDNFGVAPDKATCVPLGIRSDLRPLAEEACRLVLERLGLPESYLLHVGTIEPRKNLLILMRAYGDLPAPMRERCPLVLAGGWGWNVAAIADYYHGVARHQGVRHLGYVSDDDLPALYNSARALIFPSHYEGFGLPPLEMLACGGAVIASTAGAVVETVGRHVHLVETEDLAGWRAAMHRVITDNEWWHSLRRDGQEVARPYTWQRCADETFRVYSEVMGISSPSPADSVRINA